MKNIKKSIMLATALFVTTGALADNHYKEDRGCQKQKEYNYKKHHNKDSYKEHRGYKNHSKYDRRSHVGDVSRFFIGAVYNLELTKEQETKIDKTIQEFKNKRFDKFNGFTKDGFDKQAFIKTRKDAKENKIKLRADLIESIYKVLDKKQIEQLNTEIEQFKKMRKTRGKNDSRCNDRR